MAVKVEVQDLDQEGNTAATTTRILATSTITVDEDNPSASLLYKIGIHPILVLKPGHMFVGYFLDEKNEEVEFLETTRLGTGHQPSTFNIAFSPILHPVQTSESWQQFLAATKYATDAFFQEVKPALVKQQPQYQFIEIVKARRAGINSIPRPVE